MTSIQGVLENFMSYLFTLTRNTHFEHLFRLRWCDRLKLDFIMQLMRVL